MERGILEMGFVGRGFRESIKWWLWRLVDGFGGCVNGCVMGPSGRVKGLWQPSVRVGRSCLGA